MSGKLSWQKRLLKWAGIALFAVLFTVIAVVVGVRLYYTDARLTALIRAQLKQHVPLDVRLGGVSLSLLSGIVIQDLVVGPPIPEYKEDILHLKELRLGYRLAPLFRKRVVVDEIAIIEPVVVLEMQGEKWNAQAAADAFKGEAPASAPAQAPPPVSTPAPSGPTEPQPLGLEVALDALRLESFSARVISPDLSADIDRINAIVSGTYSGDKAQAKVHVFVGEDKAPSRVRYQMKDIGAGTLALVFDMNATALSLTEAAVEMRVRASEMQGTAAGFVLPPLPLDLSLAAGGNLATQKAQLSRFSASVGTAVALSFAAQATEILGDPDVMLDKLVLTVAVEDALALLPTGMVPVRARGAVSVSVPSLHARLSALKARTPFDAVIDVALNNVAVDQGELHVKDIGGTLAVRLARDADISASGAIAVAHLSQPGLGVGGTRVKLAVTAPASAMRQTLETPLHAKIAISVPEVTQGDTVRVNGTELVLDVTAHDMKGEQADVDMGVSVAALTIDDPKLGHASYPVKLALKAKRKAPALAIDSFQLAIADTLIRFGLAGSVVQRPEGATDLDVSATLEDVDIAKLVAQAPSLKRKELEAMALSGSTNMTLAIKGRVPADIGARLQKPVDQVLDQGTPFDLDLQLGWQNIALKNGDNTLSGIEGALSVQTHPRRESIQLDTRVASLEASGESPMALTNVGFQLDAEYLKGEAHGTGALTLGTVAMPQSLTQTLENTKLAFELGYIRELELLLKRVSIEVPTIGTSVTLRARVEQPEQTFADKAWASPTLAGLKTDATISVAVALPKKKMKLLPDNALALSGGVGFKLDVGVDKSVVKVDGAVSATHLDVDNGGLAVKDMHGVFPFSQDVTMTAAGYKLVLSSEDILRQKPRIAYYRDLRSYGRDDDGLRIDRVTSGRYVIDKIALNGKAERGKILLDYFALKLLSGDVEGQLAMQLGADRIFRLAMGAQFSNLDLSDLSKTPPGPESQINGNMQVQLEWGEKYPRELDQTTFNITRVGRRMLSALVASLDPEGKDEGLKKNRQQIETFNANINLFRVAVNHNTANVDIDTSTWLSFVGINLIERAAARRFDIRPRLEDALGATLDNLVGPYLGWTKPKDSTPKTKEGKTP